MKSVTDVSLPEAEKDTYMMCINLSLKKNDFLCELVGSFILLVVVSLLGCWRYRHDFRQRINYDLGLV